MGIDTERQWQSSGKETRDGSSRTGKNVTEIAESRLTEMLPGFSEALEAAGCRLTKVQKFSGFVNLTNRKGKLNCQYCLDVELKWKREVTNNADGEVADTATGVVKLDEVVDDDPDVEVEVDKKSKGSGAAPDKALKDLLCREATRLVVELLGDL